MTLEDKVHASRLHVLRRAEELGNASAACREAGISRTVFYRWRERFTLYGPDGLHPRHTEERPGRPPQLTPTDERKVIAAALSWPTWGPAAGVTAAGTRRPCRFLDHRVASVAPYAQPAKRSPNRAYPSSIFHPPPVSTNLRMP
jgi:hypothetical protein